MIAVKQRYVLRYRNVNRTVKYVPEWVPGAGFKRQAREWKQVITSILEDPFHAMKVCRHVPSV